MMGYGERKREGAVGTDDCIFKVQRGFYKWQQQTNALRFGWPCRLSGTCSQSLPLPPTPAPLPTGVRFNSLSILNPISANRSYYCLAPYSKCLAMHYETLSLHATISLSLSSNHSYSHSTPQSPRMIIYIYTHTHLVSIFMITM